MKRRIIFLLLPLLCGCSALPGFFAARANRALETQQPTQFTLTVSGDAPYSVHAKTIRHGSISCTDLQVGGMEFTAYIENSSMLLTNGTSETEHPLPAAAAEPFYLPDAEFSAAECSLPHKCLSLQCCISGSALQSIAALSLADGADIASACTTAIYCLDPETFLPLHIVYEISTLRGETVSFTWSEIGYEAVDLPIFR